MEAEPYGKSTVLEVKDVNGKNGKNPEELCIARRRKDEMACRSMPTFQRKHQKYEAVSAGSPMPT